MSELCQTAHNSEIVQLTKETDCDALASNTSQIYERVKAFDVSGIAFLLQQYPQLQHDFIHLDQADFC